MSNYLGYVISDFLSGLLLGFLPILGPIFVGTLFQEQKHPNAFLLGGILAQFIFIWNVAS